MKTINLTAVSFQPTLAGAEVTENLQKVVAEAIYQNAKTLAEDEFARKLYKADGEVEASDEEIGYVKAVIGGFKYFVQAAILKALGE